MGWLGVNRKYWSVILEQSLELTKYSCHHLFTRVWNRYIAYASCLGVHMHRGSGGWIVYIAERCSDEVVKFGHNVPNRLLAIWVWAKSTEPNVCVVTCSVEWYMVLGGESKMLECNSWTKLSPDKIHLGPFGAVCSLGSETVTLHMRLA